MAIATEIYLDNDFYIEVGPVVGLKVSDGSEEVMTGWADLTARLCLTDDWDETAIDPDVEVILVEASVTPPAEGDAIYRGAIEGEQVSAHLAAYLDTTVYLHILKDQDYHTVHPLLVREARVN
jgi:hypothetical protein